MKAAFILQMIRHQPMKYLYLLLLLFVLACSGQYTPPADATDCGRQFIDAIFKGNFKRAGQLILPDAANKNLLEDKLSRDFHNRTSADREELAATSIVINRIEPVSDSVTFINFINSYDKKPAVLKLVKREGQWYADLKYTFSGNL